MSKTSTLILLINSLSKGEKRFFKLYAGLQQGAKDYLHLFEVIENNRSQEQIKNAFVMEKPKTSFEATSKYLYKVLTDCLLQLRTDQGKSNSLLINLMKANILFEKSIYNEGFKQLRKVQADAKDYEQHLVQLWAAKLELYYLSNLNFTDITEAELVQKQMKIDELLRYAKNVHQHASLYELLRHRLLYKGGARTTQQKAELNDLVVSELNLASHPSSKTFEVHKTHLLFQSHYFISINDYRSALHTFYELNQLFEDNEFLWIDSPIDYLTTMEGILDSLHTIGQYDEMHLFLNKLTRLQSQSIYFEIMVERVTFIYSIIGMLDRGNYHDAIELKKHFEPSLFKKIKFLDLSKQAEVYLYTSLIYVVAGNFSKAHHFLNLILLESKLYSTFPVYRTVRLIHMLVHFELNNHDYIEYETRSIKRGLAGDKGSGYRLEKIIFTFINQAAALNGSDMKLALWKKLEKAFRSVDDDKFELQLLKIFDFKSWIEAKLLKKDFALLLKEKHRRQQK